MYLTSIWAQKTPKQKWTVLYDLAEFLSGLLQIRTLCGRQNGPFAYLPIVSGCAYFALLIYTVSYYILIGRFRECLSSFCISGLIVSVSANCDSNPMSIE